MHFDNPEHAEAVRADAIDALEKLSRMLGWNLTSPQRLHLQAAREDISHIAVDAREHLEGVAQRILERNEDRCDDLYTLSERGVE